MFTIEKNIPLPKFIHTGRNKYPFEQMEVEDSFFAPVKRETLVNAVSSYKKKSGKDFVVITEGEGARIWRTV